MPLALYLYDVRQSDWTEAEMLPLRLGLGYWILLLDAKMKTEARAPVGRSWCGTEHVLRKKITKVVICHMSYAILLLGSHMPQFSYKRIVEFPVARNNERRGGFEGKCTSSS